MLFNLREHGSKRPRLLGRQRHILLRHPPHLRLLGDEVWWHWKRFFGLELVGLPHGVADVTDCRRRLQHDDGLTLHLGPLGDVDGNLHSGSARRADEETLLRGEAVGHRNALGRRRMCKLIDPPSWTILPRLPWRQLLEQWQGDPRARTDDAMQVWFLTDENPTLTRFDTNNMACRIPLLQVAADAIESTAGACARDEAIDLSASLLPDLRASSMQMCNGIIRVVELAR
mmetsp:Transcript_21597/g.46520  ORF Transcript_21597/g.46520 Transcript_21597/m.46520 type:complete len:229 (-) Transcript_21597:541-1227(-)